jgi:hypothetical protein
LIRKKKMNIVKIQKPHMQNANNEQQMEDFYDDHNIDFLFVDE